MSNILTLYNILKIQMNVVYLVSFSWKEREPNKHPKERNNQEGSPNDIIYFLIEEKATKVGMQLCHLPEKILQQLRREVSFD